MDDKTSMAQILIGLKATPLNEINNMWYHHFLYATLAGVNDNNEIKAYPSELNSYCI